MKKLLAFCLLCVLIFTACTPVPSTLLHPASPPPAEPSPIVDEMQSQIRYVFEQFYLPYITYRDQRQEIVQMLQALDSDAMYDFLLAAWGDMLASLFQVEDTLLIQEELDLIAQSHILEVRVEMLDDENRVYAAIIKLLDIQEFLRSTYIAITYHVEHGLQIFTLEQSHGFHMFCFVSEDSRGSFFAVENSREAFIEVILEVIEDKESFVGLGQAR